MSVRTHVRFPYDSSVRTSTELSSAERSDPTVVASVMRDMVKPSSSMSSVLAATYQPRALVDFVGSVSKGAGRLVVTDAVTSIMRDMVKPSSWSASVLGETMNSIVEDVLRAAVLEPIEDDLSLQVAQREKTPHGEPVGGALSGDRSGLVNASPTSAATVLAALVTMVWFAAAIAWWISEQNRTQAELRQLNTFSLTQDVFFVAEIAKVVYLSVFGFVERLMQADDSD